MAANGVEDQNKLVVGRRMTVGLWLRLNGPDLLTLAAMGALGLGIYELGEWARPKWCTYHANGFADPAPTRSFPVFNTDGSIVYPQFAYPLRKEIVPIWCVCVIRWHSGLACS